MGTTQVQQIRLQQHYETFRPIPLMAVDFGGHFMIRDRDKDVTDNHILHKYFVVVRLNCIFYK